MSNAKTLTRKVFEALLAAFVLAFAFFVLGFLVGYFVAIPYGTQSQFGNAVDSGLFFAAISLILDPVLYFSWVSYRMKKRGGIK